MLPFGVRGIIVIPLFAYFWTGSASCNTETVSYVYGDTFTCNANLYIQHHCNLLESDEYEVVATVDGVTGPTVRGYSSKTDAKLNAVYQFFQQRNVSCNCRSEGVMINECAVTMKNCWTFENSADVSTNHVQYETWTNHSDYTGHSGPDHDINVTETKAIQQLMAVDPQCFTPSPTTELGLELDDCKGPIAFDGTRCLSGFNRSSSNPDVCCKCPYPTAGHDGQCEPCKLGTEPTFNRITCEKVETFWDSVAGNLTLVGIGAIVGAIVTVVTEICCKSICRKLDLCNGEDDGDKSDASVPMVSPNATRSDE